MTHGLFRSILFNSKVKTSKAEVLGVMFHRLVQEGARAREWLCHSGVQRADSHRAERAPAHALKAGDMLVGQCPVGTESWWAPRKGFVAHQDESRSPNSSPHQGPQQKHRSQDFTPRQLSVSGPPISGDSQLPGWTRA